ALKEAMILLEVLALVVEALPCRAAQLLVGPGSEDRRADLEHDLLRGALLLIRGRLRAGLRRPPTSARLAEIPDQLVEAHVRAEEVEGREVARGLRADESRTRNDVRGAALIRRRSRDLRQEARTSLVGARLRCL